MLHFLSLPSHESHLNIVIGMRCTAVVKGLFLVTSVFVIKKYILATTIVKEVRGNNNCHIQLENKESEMKKL